MTEADVTRMHLTAAEREQESLEAMRKAQGLGRAGCLTEVIVTADVYLANLVADDPDAPKHQEMLKASSLQQEAA